jgi:hypothetical protein
MTTNATRKAARLLVSASAERTRGCPSSPYLAADDERAAAELLTLDAPPELGIGGEMIPADVPGAGQVRAIIRETLTRDATAVAADASAARAELYLVAWGGIEPPTRGFSIRCSTN